MSTLLKIQSSLFGSHGQSSALVDNFTRQWLEKNPAARVIERNLADNPVPHLNQERFQAFITASQERTPRQQAIVAESDALIDEIRQADVLVIGVPMYNFSVPSVLRAYFDHIARAGVSFRYTANGSEGLLVGKKAYVFMARGGYYGVEHSHTSYLREFLAFIGITDVEFVYAEGLAINENSKLKGIAEAEQKIPALVAA